VRDFLSDVAVVLEWSFRAPVIVVGHSMGGRVAARLAAERPELVRALVLLDPRVSPADEEAVSRWNETFLAQRHGRSHDTRDSAEQSFRVLPEEPGIPDAIVALLARHAVVERRPGEWALCSDRAALAVYGDRIGGMLDVLGRISCPTLLACGAETHIMTPADARAYAAALHKGQLATVPGRHHFLLSHPAEAAAAARSFLERLG
jgi:pimeloyl-ACP methyl ester carboxylesterase